MTELTRETLDKLAEPFPADVIEFKPGATSPSGDSALALAYVKVHFYIERLNEIVGSDWSDDYEFVKPGMPLCRLTICGVMRSNIGEKEESDRNTETSAIAQAFKRACSKFGLGLHLYNAERVWVGYDKQKKQFTSQGLAQLRRLVSGDVPALVASQPTQTPTQAPAKSSGNGQGKVTSTDYWTKVKAMQNEGIQVDGKAILQEHGGGKDFAKALAHLEQVELA